MATAAQDPTDEIQDELDAHTVALRIVAGLLIVGAFHLLGAILVPFFLAMVLAVAMSPAADWLERKGLPRVLTSLLGTLFVAAALIATTAVIVYQVGTILQDSDRYLDQMSGHLSRLSKTTGGDELMQSLGMVTRQTAPGTADTPLGPGSPNRPEMTPGAPAATSSEATPADSNRFWSGLLRRHLSSLGRWLLTGLGGILGFFGATIIFLAFLFYMILTRSEWVERLRLASRSLGLRPRTREVDQVRTNIEIYVKNIALVSVFYVVTTTLVLWAMGVPQPLLWGVLTGLLEVVPYFGPLIAGTLPTLVALGTGDNYWVPIGVVVFFAALQTIEGYVVAPMLYGKAVDIDPVTVLLGVLFFGWLWGPLGLALAMPMLIILRGLLAITPGTPALDALVDANGEAAATVA